MIILVVMTHAGETLRFVTRTKRDARKLQKLHCQNVRAWRLWDDGWFDSSHEEAWREITEAEGPAQVVLYI